MAWFWQHCTRRCAFSIWQTIKITPLIVTLKLTKRDNKMTSIKQKLALMLPIFLAVFFSANLQASLVTNDHVINKITHTIDKEMLLENMQHAEIQAKFIKMGINKSDLEARITQMTHAEITELNNKMSELPAASGAGGILVTLLLVFIVTDVIGATDIFPFIHPVN